MFNAYYQIEVLRDCYDKIIAFGNIAVAATLFLLIYQTIKHHGAQKHQTEIDSLKVLHKIRCQISYHWQQYRKDIDQEFHLGELLGQYEYACLTCNLHHMSTETTQCFETELIETLCSLFSGERGEELYKQYLSGSDTFKEIKGLLERRADLVEQRNTFLKSQKS
ncbi:hypothetical protein [Terasakiella pusilla]|uniref:hypothetical protein n=1 Tax=Terasakiella pusilla TaxID=64973 RepID=UPI003AA986A2